MREKEGLPTPESKRVKDPDAEAFGRRLRRLRQRRRWSQEHLGGMAGLDRSYISELERAVKSPGLGTILKLARALDCPVGQLVRRD